MHVYATQLRLERFLGLCGAVRCVSSRACFRLNEKALARRCGSRPMYSLILHFRLQILNHHPSCRHLVQGPLEQLLALSSVLEKSLGCWHRCYLSDPCWTRLVSQIH